MPIFAWMHYYAFSWSDYNDTRLSSRLSFTYALKDAIGFKDIIYDAYLTFIQSPKVQSNTDDIWSEDADGSPLLGYRPIVNELEHIPLIFEDVSDEENSEYESSRRLDFGDYNFPVIHADPRFAEPPRVQAELLVHASDFHIIVEGHTVPKRKLFETEQEIQERLLGWTNISRS